jgi:DNA-directed RNA polymerase subunit RPC12/RpoP
MSVFKCPECHEEISTEAERCPYCGASFPSKTKSKGFGFEWQSSKTFYGYPLVNIAFGRDAENRLRVAKGIVAIGQFGIGLITFAQFGIGILFGFGQFIIGFTAIAQIAVSAFFAIGQIATGYIAIGQVAFGFYALCQTGFAKYLWIPEKRDAEAVEIFYQLYGKIKDFLHLSH